MGLPLESFRPEPKLVVDRTEVTAPRFDVIDVHNHIEGPFGGWTQLEPQRLLDVMDEAGVHVLVDLDGGWGEKYLDDHLRTYKALAPDRFVMFGGVDWARWPDDGDAFASRAADRFRAQVARGAQGLKIWKPFGLHVRDHTETLVRVDDPRLDELWDAAGDLGVPVLIHVADPVAFFEPVGPNNERYEELHAHPDWAFSDARFPTFDEIIEGLAAIVHRHPATTFIGAHVGCYAENLAWVSDLMSSCPNFHVDISGRLAELGRQPYTARRFFVEWADRILFGLDLPADVAEYRLHYRFLETDDEYFPYSTQALPPQGRWMIYGLHLPDDVLRKVYADNARRLLGLG